MISKSSSWSSDSGGLCFRCLVLSFYLGALLADLLLFSRFWGNWRFAWSSRGLYQRFRSVISWDETDLQWRPRRESRSAKGTNDNVLGTDETAREREGENARRKKEVEVDTFNGRLRAHFPFESACIDWSFAFDGVTKVARFLTWICLGSFLELGPWTTLIMSWNNRDYFWASAYAMNVISIYSWRYAWLWVYLEIRFRLYRARKLKINHLRD